MIAVRPSTFVRKSLKDASFGTARERVGYILGCIRNEEVNRPAETPAARTHRNRTDPVKLALEHELPRLDQALPLRLRPRPIQDRVLARPATGLEADKAFYDELSGEA